MSNWKLGLWAALAALPLCETCGELYGTTTITDPASRRPACEFCAAWVAAGSPEDYDLTAWQAATDSLPRLLRYRPGLRVLNCSTAAYYSVAEDPEERAEAYEQLRRDYAAASWPVRLVYQTGQELHRWWDEATPKTCR